MLQMQTTVTDEETGETTVITTTEQVWNANAKYYNTGAYDTQGLRYAQTFGNFGFMLSSQILNKQE